MRHRPRMPRRRTGPPWRFPLRVCCGTRRRAKVKRPPRPSPVVMTKRSEQQRYLESLKRQAHHGRRRSWWLGLAAAGVILVTIGTWLLYQASTVLRYAQLAPGDPPPAQSPRSRIADAGLSAAEPRIVGSGAPMRATTEVLDQVVLEAGTPEQSFLWRWNGVRPGGVDGHLPRRLVVVSADAASSGSSAAAPVGRRGAGGRSGGCHQQSSGGRGRRADRGNAPPCRHRPGRPLSPGPGTGRPGAVRSSRPKVSAPSNWKRIWCSSPARNRRCGWCSTRE